VRWLAPIKEQGSNHLACYSQKIIHVETKQSTSILVCEALIKVSEAESWPALQGKRPHTEICEGEVGYHPSILVHHSHATFFMSDKSVQCLFHRLCTTLAQVREGQSGANRRSTIVLGRHHVCTALKATNWFGHNLAWGGGVSIYL